MAKTTATRKRNVESSTESQGQATKLQPTGGSHLSTTMQSTQLSNYSTDNDWQQGGLKNLDEIQLARGLGWFSIGLGLAEILAPEGLAKLIGVHKSNSLLIRAYGLREIAAGIGILSQRIPVESVWSRVAGDALDLATMGRAFTLPKTDRGRLTAATVSVLGVTALDIICAQQLSRNYGKTALMGAVRVQKSVTIDRTPEELYNYWKNFTNLPTFMLHLESVQITGEGKSHWVAKAPAGMTAEWDAEIIEDSPNELIAWRSLPGSTVDSIGFVRFEPATGGRGTVVRVQMEYSPPGGVIGTGIAWLFGEEPEQQMKDDLRRFKQVIETGEVVRSEGAPQGTGVIMQQPGQPTAGNSEQ